MKPSFAPVNKTPKTKTNLDLEFPVDPGFISHLKPVSPDILFRHNLKMMHSFNSHSDVEERRLRDKCNVEFVL